MKKNCIFCGADMNGADVCPSCGKNQQTGEALEIQSETAPIQDKPVKKTALKIKAVLAASAAVIIVAAILTLKILYGGSYKEPVENYLKSIETGKGKYFYKCVPEFILDDEYKDMKKSDIINKLDDDAESILEGLEYALGNDVEITYKIESREKISGDVIDALEKELEEKYNKHIRISKGYELEIKFKFKSEENSGTRKVDVNVYKINGEWRLLDDINDILKGSTA